MANQEQTSDAILVKNYCNGDETALAVLISRHQAKVYGFIYVKVGNRDISNDIFQDTFIKVIKTLKANAYKEEGKFLPWVMRIAHNLTIDYFRHSKKMLFQRQTEEYSVFNFLSDESLNIENELIEGQIESDVQKLIANLPEDQQEVLKLRYYDDLSFKEIADVTGVSINTALGRMRYAVINLRKIVEKNNIVLTN